MATLDDEIASLKEKIERYENDLRNATEAEEKGGIRRLIKSCMETLTKLLKMKHLQPFSQC
jgi:hypothetical protein